MQTNSFYHLMLGSGVFLLVAFALLVSDSLLWVNLKFYDNSLSMSENSPFIPGSLLIEASLIEDGNVDYTGLGHKINLLFQQLKAFNSRKTLIITDSPLVRNQLKASGVTQPIAITPGTSQQTASDSLPPYGFGLLNYQGVIRQFIIDAEDNPELFFLNDLLLADKSAVGKNYWFNFANKLELVPRLSLDQALAGGMIKQLVDDKIVIIAVTLSRTPSYGVVTADGYGYASMGELQALATETLLHGFDVKHVSLSSTLIIILLCYLTSAVVVQLLSTEWIAAYAVLSFVLIYLISLFCLVYFHVLWPLAEWMLTQLYAVISLLIIKLMKDKQLITSALTDINIKHGELNNDMPFSASNNEWKDLHKIACQQFNIVQSVLFGRKEQSMNVMIMDLFNCEASDIYERRRDLSRSPLRDIIQTQQLVSASERRYFNTEKDSVCEYLLPLKHAGEVIGLWMVSIQKEPEWNMTGYESKLKQFAADIGVLLYSREYYRKSLMNNESVISRLLHYQYTQINAEKMYLAVSGLSKKHEKYETLLNNLSAAITLYDAFGQVTYINKKMEEIVNALSVPIYTLCCDEFLVILTQLTQSEIKYRLLLVLTEGRSVDCPITHNKLGGSYMLRIRSVATCSYSDYLGQKDLLNRGILLEFIDVSNQQYVLSQKQAVIDQHCHQVSNYLSSIHLYFRRFKRGLAEGKLGELDQVALLLNELSELNKAVGQQMDYFELSSVMAPVDPLSRLSDVIKSHEETLASKSIALTFKQPMLPRLVLVESEKLKNIYDLILMILIEDCRQENAQIFITAKESKKHTNGSVIIVEFRNTGFGVSKNDLEHVFNQDFEELSNAENLLEQLVYSFKSVRHWGLDVTIDSELNVGFNIGVVLPVFNVKSRVNNATIEVT